jgi:hypothetical protein
MPRMFWSRYYPVLLVCAERDYPPLAVLFGLINRECTRIFWSRHYRRGERDRVAGRVLEPDLTCKALSEKGPLAVAETTAEIITCLKRHSAPDF